MGSYQLALFPCFWLKGLEKWNLTVDLHTALKGALARLCCWSGHSIFAARAPRSPSKEKREQELHNPASDSAQQVEPITRNRNSALVSSSRLTLNTGDVIASDTSIQMHRSYQRSSIKEIQVCVSWYSTGNISCPRENKPFFCCSYLPDEWRTEKLGGFRLFPNGAK